MDQDRRDAMHWAEEWKIRRRNKRILTTVIVVIVLAVAGYAINYISIIGSRTTYGSEEEMKAALQGRFATDYAEDIVIEGDTVTLTYYNQSHYDLEYAERYGYSEYEDSVYEDTVEKWDYRKGEIKCKWMDTITVDKEGQLVYYQQKYKKTSEPKPVPIDPSELSLYKKGYNDSAQEGADGAASDGEEAAGDEAGASDTGDGTEEEAVQESREETQEAAEDAGVEAAAGNVPPEE